MKKEEIILLRRYLFSFIVLSVVSLIRCHDEKTFQKGQPETPETKDESLDTSPDTFNYTLCASRRNMDSDVRELTEVTPREFPFMAAILNNDKEFICSGSMVANGVILTTAHCLLPTPGYVMLNAIRVPSIKNDSAIYISVVGTEPFPSFSKSSSGKATNDVGIVITERINQSVASLIPLKNYSDAKAINDFTAIGYGLNTELGSPKSLQNVVLNHRFMYDLDETFSGYIDCIDTNISTCFKDTGGAAIVGVELAGVIVTGQDNCTKEMTSDYAINKLMVKVLPTFVFQKWLAERISALKVTAAADISVHPVEPVTFGPLPVPHRQSSPTPEPRAKLLRQTYSQSNSLYNAKNVFLTITISRVIMILLS